VSQRIDKPQTMGRKTNGLAHSEVLRFEPIKDLEKTKGGVVHVNRVLCGEQFFGRLYITSDRYSLVWRNSTGFKFELPYLFMEFQFLGKPKWYIKEFSLIFPFRKEKKNFSYQHAIASIFLQGEESARGFDMLDEKAQKRYCSELIDKRPDSISRIAFARYDSEIVFQIQFYKITFTAERLNQEANNDWEFVINLPRQIVLNQRSISWVAENHESSESMRKMNLDASYDALSKVLSR